MADADTAGSPLEAVGGAASPEATDAFALLGNETRLAALLAIWEEYDPRGGDNAVPFSRIFERVDYDDPGNLRYHLEKLDGHFLRQHAAREGYELRELGVKLVRAVIAGAGVADARREPAVIDQDCPLCGAPTSIGYRDGLVVFACTECPGPTPGATDTDGFLSATPFPPAGLEGRTPAEIRVASWVAARRQVRTFFDGFCPECAGSVDSRLDYCSDHDPDGICDHCGKQFVAWARFQCRVCKNHSVSSPKGLALFHPAVIAFYDDHGVSTRVRAGDLDGAARVFGLMDDHGMELVSEAPTRVDVTAALDGDEVRLTFDEAANVVDVRR